MKAFIIVTFTLAGSALYTACWADGMYWVVGNRATNRCDIVSANPVIDGDIWFGDGPYSSIDDARLARSTIGACRSNSTNAE